MKGKATNPRSLQIAMVLDGQPYSSSVAAALSVNTKSKPRAAQRDDAEEAQ